MSEKDLEKNKFPYQLTNFVDKINARYDGDPLGDFVMAEHINTVQDAVEQIEKTIGIRINKTETIEQRLQRLTDFEAVQLPEVGYFDNLTDLNNQYLQEIVKRYSFLILKTLTPETKELSKKNKIYGEISTDGITLEDIQNRIVSWKQSGAQGIFLNGLEKEAREEEINIIESIKDHGMKLIVSGDIVKLLTSQPSEYNVEGKRILFPEETIFAIKDFGYTDRLIPFDVVMNNLLPTIRLIRENNYSVMGFSDTQTQSLYNSVHTLGLLLSLDYMYYGKPTGSNLEQLPYTFNWPLMMSVWRTNSPNLFLNNNVLERHLLNGSIQLKSNGEVKFQGLQESSELIGWDRETVPGNTIKKGSIPPDRLSTYDIEKIIRLINESPDIFRINPEKINSQDNDYFLPGSIGASHLIENVIKAINKKNNDNTLEFEKIENYSIKNLKATQLIGDIQTDALVENVIDSINLAATNYADGNYLNIPYANINNIYGSGQLEYSRILSDWATFTSADIQGELLTESINNSGHLTSVSGEFGTVTADSLEVPKITGVENLSVSTLEADNIESLVIESIEAKIARGEFDTIITSTLESQYVVSEIIRATTNFSNFSDIDKANISGLIAGVLIADYAFISDLDAGFINTDKIQLTTDSGLMGIEGDTIRVYSYPDENNVRNLRILIGALKEVTGNEEDYGFVALSQDGQTRIFDHTGVYEAGIHEGSISEDKIQEDAVTGSKIRYKSIEVDHLIGGIITGDWIDGETISGTHIIGESITADHLKALSIETRHLNGDIIEGSHIKGNTIEAEHIRAGAITADKLKIEYGLNLIKEGYDSFEQYPKGEIELSTLNNDVRTVVVEEGALEGKKAVEAMSYERDSKLHIGEPIDVNVEKLHAFSVFIRTPRGLSSSEVQLGFYLTNGEDGEYLSSGNHTVRNVYRRFSFTIENFKNYTKIIPVIFFTESNQTILIDALQVEEVDAPGAISPWGTTSTTTISGDNITTGRIDAKHIQIGQGTIFADGDIIEITDEGIIAKNQNGSAALNSKGLEIKGGAFDISSGVLGNKSFRIADGKLTAESLFNLIEIDPDKGFRIINKENSQILFDTDPVTGEIRMSGSFRVYTKDNPEMAYDPDSTWTIEDKINEIKNEIEIVEKAPGPPGQEGKPGMDAISYWLTSSVDTITVKYNGDYDPKTITYYGYSKKGSNNTQNYAGRFIIQTSLDGTNFTEAYRSLVDMDKVDFSVPEDVLFIKAKFYQAGGTTYLLDEQTTPILHSADGVKQEIKRTQNTAWVRAGMRIGYSSFTQKNPNSVYICGLEYRDGYRDMVLVDKFAEIYVRDSGQTDTIPNQALSVSGIPAGTTAYIIWDNTKKELFFIYYESVMTSTGVSKKRWRNIKGDTIEFTDSLFAIGEVEV